MMVSWGAGRTGVERDSAGNARLRQLDKGGLESNTVVSPQGECIYMYFLN